jgi:ABC-type microcin C transport system permease subunit YejB
MLEVLQQDYIRTARAKGVGQRSILFLHALKKRRRADRDRHRHRHRRC